MTKFEVERWREVAERMTRLYSAWGRPGRAWILATVRWFFDHHDLTGEEDDDWSPHIHGWSNCDWSDSAGCGLRAPLGYGYPCDAIQNFSEVANPYYWKWDEDDYRGPETGFESRAGEQFEVQWMGPVVVCVRAGLDAVTGESGVIGFTAGKLRSLWPEGVPDWIKKDEPWGVFMDESAPGLRFDDIPDVAGVIL